ncbi:hypothetical protein Tco_0765524 [Tanacetum coccineum]
MGPQKRTPTQPASQPSTSSQVPMSETMNADGREMGDGVPTQSSAAGGAKSDNGKFLMVNEEDLTFKKLAPMTEEIIMLSEGLGGGGYLRDYVMRVVARTNEGDYVRVVFGMDDGDSDGELLIPTWSDESKNEKRGKRQKALSNEKTRLARKHMCDEVASIHKLETSGDLVEMPSEVVKQGMDDHVPDEIDGAKCEQVPNHVVNKGNLEVLVCKQVANHGGDELVDKGRPLKRKRVYAE